MTQVPQRGASLISFVKCIPVIWYMILQVIVRSLRPSGLAALLPGLVHRDRRGVGTGEREVELVHHVGCGDGPADVVPRQHLVAGEFLPGDGRQEVTGLLGGYAADAEHRRVVGYLLHLGHGPPVDVLEGGHHVEGHHHRLGGVLPVPVGGLERLLLLFLLGRGAEQPVEVQHGVPGLHGGLVPYDEEVLQTELLREVLHEPVLVARAVGLLVSLELLVERVREGGLLARRMVSFHHVDPVEGLQLEALHLIHHAGGVHDDLGDVTGRPGALVGLHVGHLLVQEGKELYGSHGGVPVEYPVLHEEVQRRVHGPRCEARVELLPEGFEAFLPETALEAEEEGREALAEALAGELVRVDHLAHTLPGVAGGQLEVHQLVDDVMGREGLPRAVEDDVLLQAVVLPVAELPEDGQLGVGAELHGDAVLVARFLRYADGVRHVVGPLGYLAGRGDEHLGELPPRAGVLRGLLGVDASQACRLEGVREAPEPLQARGLPVVGVGVGDVAEEHLVEEGESPLEVAEGELDARNVIEGYAVVRVVVEGPLVVPEGRGAVLLAVQHEVAHEDERPHVAGVAPEGVGAAADGRLLVPFLHLYLREGAVGVAVQGARLQGPRDELTGGAEVTSVATAERQLHAGLGILHRPVVKGDADAFGIGLHPGDGPLGGEVFLQFLLQPLERRCAELQVAGLV